MCMKENLIHSRTCVYNVNYHVVWSVKYRRKIITQEIEARIKQIVYEVSADKGFTVQLCESGEMDHIHCFISAPPKISISYIVKMRELLGIKIPSFLLRRYNLASASHTCQRLWTPQA